MKHAKVKRTTPQPDGTSKIETESYYEQLNNVREEIQQSIKTDKATFIKDVMQCFAVLSDKDSREVTVRIETDKDYQPIRIIKTWTIRKEHYGNSR